MTKRMVMALTLVLVLAGVAGIQRAAAQEIPPPEVSLQKRAGKEELIQLRSIDSYNVEFTVSELDNGKKLNSRSYSMQIPNIPARGSGMPPWTEWKRLRVGSRVPIPSLPGNVQWQYQNVGMDIDCRMFPMENGKITMGTTWDYSSVAGDGGHDTAPPVIRQVRSEVEAVVPLDKPTVISEVDDVGSTHRFVFEVKVTKVTP